MTMNSLILITLVYGLMSLVTYGVYALDQSAARRRRHRVPERTLHLLALFGGWPGASLAQHLLRHKSSKSSFLRLFWLTVLLNCALLAGLLRQLAS